MAPVYAVACDSKDCPALPYPQRLNARTGTVLWMLQMPWAFSRRQHGRCEGRKPFGTRPGEQNVIEKILGLRRGTRSRERMSFAQIAELLNTEAVPTRQGKMWKPGTVYKLVKDHRPALTSRE